MDDVKPDGRRDGEPIGKWNREVDPAGQRPVPILNGWAVPISDVDRS